jgi:hypothetical protein
VDDNTPGSVASDTVPALIDLLPGKHCDLLKLDIEGAELGVFTMPDLSWIERVSVILIETHGAEARNAVNFAASLFGMKIEQVGEKVMLSRSAR